MKKANFVLFSVLILSVLLVSACTTQAPVQSGAIGNIPATGDTGATSAASGTPATTSGGTAASGATVKELKIEAYNFGFRVLNDVQINKGDTVKLTVSSSEGTHGLAMPDYNIDLSPIAPGESKTIEFTADKSGTFTYFCNVPCGPGHRSMTGTLTVT